jgi:hypothetical protein
MKVSYGGRDSRPDTYDFETAYDSGKKKAYHIRPIKSKKISNDWNLMEHISF